MKYYIIFILINLKLLFGKSPYVASDINQLLIKIKNNPLVLPSDVKLSQPVRDVLHRMLVMDPEKRISWEELFNHKGIF